MRKADWMLQYKRAEGEKGFDMDAKCACFLCCRAEELNTRLDRVNSRLMVALQLIPIQQHSASAQRLVSLACAALPFSGACFQQTQRAQGLSSCCI
jgi:hypothetical protein